MRDSLVGRANNVLQKQQENNQAMDVHNQKETTPGKALREQNELLVVTGSNYTSNINIIRKGISVKDHMTLDQLPAILQDGGLFCAADKLFIRVLGIPEIIVAKLESQEVSGKQKLHLIEQETPAAIQQIQEKEEILLIKSFQDTIAFVTDQKILITTDDLTRVINSKEFENDMITSVDYKNDILLISLLEGVVQAYELKENNLKLLGEINLG